MDYPLHQADLLQNRKNFHEQHQQGEEEPEEETSCCLTRGGGVEANGSMDSAGICMVPHCTNPHDSSSRKLFIGGVSWDTTEESFAKYFSKYGKIVDSVIMTNKLTGRSRGFGFVTFSDPDVAEDVLAQEHIIDGRVVEVKRTVPKEDMKGEGILRTRKIFVGGTPPSFTSDALKEYFSTYGSISDCRIMVDCDTGRSRGFGFVTFENEDSVQKVFALGKRHELGGKQVEIKRAVPKRDGYDHSNSSAKANGCYARGTSKPFEKGLIRSQNGAKRGKINGEYGTSDANGILEGNYGVNPAMFYGGYGGYNYGYPYGNSMFCFVSYGFNSYAVPANYGFSPAFSNPNCYGRSNGHCYNSSHGFERVDVDDEIPS